MLRGRNVALRAVTKDDFGELYSLRADAEGMARSSGVPWLPITEEAARARVDSLPEDKTLAYFAVTALNDGRVLGQAQVFNIDHFNRNAEFGMALLPAARGGGLAVDTLQVCCDYGFRLLGLHRMYLGTSISNTPMRKTAESVGFRFEGVLRGNAWRPGGFEDEVMYGLLASEWNGNRDVDQEEDGEESVVAGDG